MPFLLKGFSLWVILSSLTLSVDDHQIIKDNPDLQVRGVIKMGNKCQAHNKDGVLMTLNADQCDYYTQQAGRVWKSGQTSANSSSASSVTETVSTTLQAPSAPVETPSPTEPATPTPQ